MRSVPTWGSDVVHDVETGLRAFDPRPRSLGELMDVACGFGTREFLVQGDRRLTFESLDEEVELAARHLESRGVGPGSRVMVLGANGIDWVVAFLALFRVGAVVVLGNRWWTAPDVEWAVSTVSASLVLADGRGAAILPANTEAVALDGLAVRTPGTDEGAESVRGAVDEADPALVIFTSGTTSRPKAVELSHRSVIANVHNLLERTGNLPPSPRAEQDVALCSLPLFHVGGAQTVLFSLVTGGRLVFLEGRFDPGQVLRLIEVEQVTSWSAIPTMVSMVLEHPDLQAHDLGSLRSVALGGAPVPADIANRIRSAMPNVRRRIAQNYGSTEAGTIATGSHDRTLKPLRTTEIRLMPRTGGEGEILVRSPTVMNGYIGLPEADQPVDAEGWLHTGDRGRLDDGGGLLITGRIKDLIIRGGENIAPQQVEQVLQLHPEVLDVAVVGLAHPIWGEEVGAAVRLTPGAAIGEEELREYAGSRLPRFAVPTRWTFVTEPLPTGDTGKMLRRMVAEMFPTAQPHEDG